MAGPGSRLEKFGTIYSRVTGLLKSGAIKYSERPVWYDVYAAFPPKEEPTLSRPKPAQTVPNILYMEDFVRAKFYEKFGTADVIDMKDHQNPSVCQRFVAKYMEMEKKDVENGDIFQAVVDALEAEGIKLKTLEEIKEERLKMEATEKPRGEFKSRTLDMKDVMQDT